MLTPSCCFLLESSIVGSRLHSLLLSRVISFIRFFYHWAVTLSFVCLFVRSTCDIACCADTLLVSFYVDQSTSRGSDQSKMWFFVPVVESRNSGEPVPLIFRSFVWSCSLHPNGRFIVPLWLSSATCAGWCWTLFCHAFTSVGWSDMPSRCEICFALGILIYRATSVTVDAMLHVIDSFKILRQR
jgi:hypothetical protein